MENKEKRLFYDWSVRHGHSHNYPVYKGAASCFIKRDVGNYMEEYNFETIVEVKTNLARIWSEEKFMEEIIKPVAVAVMRNEPKKFENKRKEQSLDEFIYIF